MPNQIAGLIAMLETILIAGLGAMLQQNLIAVVSAMREAILTTLFRNA